MTTLVLQVTCTEMPLEHTKHALIQNSRRDYIIPAPAKFGDKIHTEQ